MTQWLLPLYKWVGVDHPKASLVAMFLLGGIIFGGMWYLTGREYQDSLKKTQSPNSSALIPPVQIPEKPKETTQPDETKPSAKVPVRKPRDKTPVEPSHEDWLTDTQKQNISATLKEREKDKAAVRLVCIGESPKYADQIQEAFAAAQWPIQRLNMGSASFSGTGPMSEPLYILTPNAESPTAKAVVAALENGRIAAPMHLDMPTIGPASLGVPAVTIVIQKK